MIKTKSPQLKLSTVLLSFKGTAKAEVTILAAKISGLRTDSSVSGENASLTWPACRITSSVLCRHLLPPTIWSDSCSCTSQLWCISIFVRSPSHSAAPRLSMLTTWLVFHLWWWVTTKESLERKIWMKKVIKKKKRNRKICPSKNRASSKKRRTKTRMKNKKWEKTRKCK